MTFSTDLLRSLRETLNTERRLTFGESAALTLFSMTPEGEIELGAISDGWGGRRLTATAAGQAEAGEWTFRVCAADALAEAAMRKAATLTVGGVKWKVRKVERPVGPVGTWAFRAERV
jgi:hypothetical protein